MEHKDEGLPVGFVLCAASLHSTRGEGVLRQIPIASCSHYCISGEASRIKGGCAQSGSLRVIEVFYMQGAGCVCAYRLSSFAAADGWCTWVCLLSFYTHPFSSCSIGPGDLDLEQDAHLQRYTFGNVLWYIVNARQSELFGLLPVLFGSKSPWVGETSSWVSRHWIAALGAGTHISVSVFIFSGIIK